VEDARHHRDLLQQKAELPDIKVAMPDYGDVHSQVLQDAVLRVDHAFQSFFQRIRDGKTPGYPRFHGRNRYTSFTYPQVGEHGSARLDNGFVVLSKIGRIALRWSRPLKGTPKTVTVWREADGWYDCFSCAEVPLQPLEPTGKQAGIDLGLESFASLSDGTVVHNPAAIARPRHTCGAASGGWHGARRGATAGVRRSSCSPRRTRR
jgi:putative transposase